MLSDDERVGAQELVRAGISHAAYTLHPDHPDYRRVVRLAHLLENTIWTYDAERCDRGRLDCLTTAVKSIAGALRERVYGAGEAAK